MLVNVAMFSSPTQCQSRRSGASWWMKPAMTQNFVSSLNYIMKKQRNMPEKDQRSALGKKMECLDQILILIVRWCMQCHLAEPGCNRDSERSEVTPAAFQSLWTSSQEEREQRIICLIFIMKSVCFGSACVWVCLTIFCGQNSPQKLAKCLQRYKLFMNKVHEFMKKC